MLSAQVEHTPEGAVSSSGMRFSAPTTRDSAFRRGKPLRKLTMTDLKNWLARPLAKGYMEVAIVGDIAPERALQLVAKTLGTLPRRDAVKPAFAQERADPVSRGAENEDHPVRLQDAPAP